MNLNLTISRYPLTGAPFAGQIRVAIYEAESPTAIVAFQDFDAPHTVSRSVSFADVNNVTHVVKVSALPSTLLLSYQQQPKDYSYEAKLPYFFRIGDGQPDTPEVGESSFSSSLLEGWEYWVERRGPGALPDDFTNPIHINKITNGFELAQEGDVFYEDDYFAIHFLPKPIQSVGGTGAVAKWFDGTVVISTNTAYEVAHLRKLILMRAAASTLTYTLPQLSDYPIGFPIAIQTMGNEATYNVATTNSELIEWGGGDLSNFELTNNSFLILVRDTTKWQVVSYSSGAGGGGLSDNPELNDPATGASTVATKILWDKIKFLGSGLFTPFRAGNPVGDIVGVNDDQIIIHNLNISGPYYIQGSIKSNFSPDHWRDARITWAFYDCTANSFKVLFAENASYVQNIQFYWQAFKP